MRGPKMALRVLLYIYSSLGEVRLIRALADGNFDNLVRVSQFRDRIYTPARSCVAEFRMTKI